MSQPVKTLNSEILNQLLISDNEAQSCYAARAIGSIFPNITTDDDLALEGPEAIKTVESLIECLHHQDVDVVIDAVDALGSLQAKAATDILLDAVNLHPEGDVRVSAIRALSNMVDDSLLECFLPWANGEFAHRQTDTLWNDDWDVQLIAIETLGKHRFQGAVEILRTLLQENNLDIEGQVLKALTLIGNEGLLYVISLIENTRRAPSLIEQRLARRAATALTFAHCKQSIATLTQALKANDANLRASAVTALGKRQAQQSAIDMLELLDDADSQVVTATITALTSMQQLLKEQFELYVSSEYLLLQLPKLNTSGRNFVYQLLTLMAANITLDQAQKKQLHQALSSESLDEQIYICQLLSAIGDDTAVPVIMQHLTHSASNAPSMRATQAMLLSLGKLAANETLTLCCLNTLLEHPSSSLRLSVVQALVSIAQKPALQSEFSAHTLIYDYLLKSTTIDNSFIENPVFETENSPEDDENKPLIPIQAIDVNGDNEALHTAPPALSEDDKLRAILASVSDEYPPAELHTESVTEEAIEHVNFEDTAVVSTLDSIQRETINAFVSPKADIADEVTAPHIREMVEQLPQSEQQFAQIVNDHLDSGERVKLSRKKIAKMPTYPNKVLALKALTQYPSEDVVDTLLAQFLFDDVEVQIEAVSSLAIIAQQQPQLKALKKCLGPLCTLLMSGNDHLRLMCARAIGALGHRTALPILLEALADTDSNVRIQVIDSLHQYLAINQQSHSISKSFEKIMPYVFACLQDSATGVVIRALAFFAENHLYLQAADKEEVLSAIITAGCAKDDYLVAASNSVTNIDRQSAGKQLFQLLVDAPQSEQRIPLLKMLTIVLAD
ncbi:MAG: HEAT repeat domain-containing protein [Oceanospirillaceae bacterium]